MTQPNHVQVAFPIPIRDAFTYAVPESLAGKVALGSHVLASLGRRRLSGFVVGLQLREDLKNVKELEALVRPEPVFDGPMLELARRVAEYYLCPLGEILAAAYPGHADKRPRQSESADRGVQEGVAPEAAAPTQSTAAPTPRTYRVDVLVGTDADREARYLRLAADALAADESVIFLVPEVSTASSLVALLKTRFGGKMALFHSTLRISERKKIWESCRSGKLRVIVGTRSAVYLPLRCLGLIVVDDEHAQPYKQEETPRYSGRDVALMRAELEGIPVVLGSATPSVETFLALKRGEYKPAVLAPESGDVAPESAGLAPVLVQPAPETERPAVTVVDMRNWDVAVPGAGEFSQPLASAVGRCVDEKRRALIFLNRRGFSTYVQCQDCGAVETCHSCELPLILHSAEGTLVCHHCGHRVQAPSSCRKCKSVRFRFGGAGIEKVVAQLRKIAPSARVARMDLESTGTREMAMAAADSFAKGELDVLVGTLLIMKGFSLGEISVVGVLHAETQLNIPDFRSGERAFQLLSEVVTLTGGGDRRGSTGSSEAGADSAVAPAGEVIIQTLNPEHHSVAAVVSGDPSLFYEQELKQREELGYPPFSTVIAVHISGANEPQVLKVVKQTGSAAASAVSSLEKDGLPVRVLGPSPAFPSRSRGQFRWRMSIIAAKREAARRAAEAVLSELGGKHDVGGVTVSVDVDPVGS